MLCYLTLRASRLSPPVRPAAISVFLLFGLSVNVLPTSWPQSPATAAAAETSKSWTGRSNVIVEGVGCKSVRVGMDREDLVQTLGEPDEDSSADVLEWNDKDIECTLPALSE